MKNFPLVLVETWTTSSEIGKIKVYSLNITIIHLSAWQDISIMWIKSFYTNLFSTTFLSSLIYPFMHGSEKNNHQVNQNAALHIQEHYPLNLFFFPSTLQQLHRDTTTTSHTPHIVLPFQPYKPPSAATAMSATHILPFQPPFISDP